jgi:hypothetical protein
MEMGPLNPGIDEPSLTTFWTPPNRISKNEAVTRPINVTR